MTNTGFSIRGFPPDYFGYIIPVSYTHLVVLSVSLVFMHEAICEVMAQLIFNVHYTSSAEVYSSPLNLLTWYACLLYTSRCV